MGVTVETCVHSNNWGRGLVGGAQRPSAGIGVGDTSVAGDWESLCWSSTTVAPFGNCCLRLERELKCLCFMWTSHSWNVPFSQRGLRSGFLVLKSPSVHCCKKRREQSCHPHQNLELSVLEQSTCLSWTRSFDDRSLGITTQGISRESLIILQVNGNRNLFGASTLGSTHVLSFSHLFCW